MKIRIAKLENVVRRVQFIVMSFYDHCEQSWKVQLIHERAVYSMIISKFLRCALSLPIYEIAKEEVLEIRGNA